MKSIAEKISGNIFTGGRMRKGTMTLGPRPEFSEKEEHSDLRGTLIPAFINAHTHIGDSFISNVPAGDIPSIVGPGGFKQRMLDTADDASIISGMKWALNTMGSTGTYAFMDFRESGRRGVQLLRNAASGEPLPVILGRPVNGMLDLDEVIGMSDGIAPSAISDVDPYLLEAMSKYSHKAGKMFGIHFSENIRENLDDLMRARPDFIVHAIEASDDDLAVLRKHGIPVAVTPRSNIYYGKRPDYSRFFKSGMKIMIGTDNGMITPPDMFSEISFLFTYQRGINPVSPEAVISAATEIPFEFLSSHGVRFSMRYIFYPGVFLNPYDIVTRGRYFSYKIIC